MIMEWRLWDEANICSGILCHRIGLASDPNSAVLLLPRFDVGCVAAKGRETRHSGL